MTCAIEIPVCEAGSWPRAGPTRLSLLRFLGGNATFGTGNAASVGGEEGVQQKSSLCKQFHNPSAHQGREWSAGILMEA